MHHRRRSILQLALLLLAASPAAMLAAGGSCEREEFPAGRSYATCADLPALGASLHWTYDAAASSLSLAFAAKPSGASGAGWVAWGVNPTGDGMKGAQTLLAFKSKGAYVVNTYNLTGYRPLSAASTPIAFEATELAADEGADGKVRLYGTLQLPKGMEAVNHIWQVGSTVANGVPAKHAFAQENLEAKGSLVLTGAGATEAAPAPDTALATWAPPPPGCVKLNVDDSFVEADSNGGVGMILRVHSGGVIFSSCRFMFTCSSALEAEAAACCEGIALALEWSQAPVIIETDCSMLASMLKEDVINR
uniref:Auxin-induced in root cultures protein 12 n=1 Tax=Aegilops tauschii TaxID=37682 RepID=R7W1D8_AEGTA